MAVAVLLLPLVIIVTRIRSRRAPTRDRIRMFPAADRRVAFERARGQCEYDRWLLWRCTRTAAHADHFFPWTRGGATNLRNCLAACARCNTSKGSKMPGRMQRLRIQARRRRYFPRGVPVELGDWCRGAS